MFERLTYWFIPHKKNRFHPHLVRKRSLVVITLLLVVALGLAVYQMQLFGTEADTAAVVASVLTDLANADRVQNHLGTLSINDKLTQAANAKALDMATKGYFSHTSPDGSLPWDWISRAGYKYSYAGENVAINFGDSANVEAAWMASRGHRANILSDHFTDVGFGIAEGDYQGKHTVFVVQMFGRPSASSTIQLIATTTNSIVRTGTPKQVAASALTQLSRTLAPRVLGASTALAPSIIQQAQASPVQSVSFLYVGALTTVTIPLLTGAFVEWRRHRLRYAGAALVFLLCFGLVLLYLHFVLGAPTLLESV